MDLQDGDLGGLCTHLVWVWSGWVGGVKVSGCGHAGWVHTS